MNSEYIQNTEIESEIQINDDGDQSLETSPLVVAEVHDIAVEGSDMTRDIHVALFKDKSRPAARSMPESELILYQDIGKASDIAQPGGFRRDHVIAAKNEDGEEIPSHAFTPFMEVVREPTALQQARKELEQTYDDFIFANFEVGLSMEDFEDDEIRTPLIRRAVQRSKALQAAGVKPSKEEVPEKGASIRKTVFTTLKSFIGSGILFLPNGFKNGGMLFSIIVLCISAVLSTICMLRLADCATVMKNKSGVSYGYLGQRAFGKVGRVAVNVSLILSQLGFCCSYLIFIEKNLKDVIQRLDHCSWIPSSLALILIQIPAYTPLTWVRKIKYFAMTNLVADVLVLFGLLYIMGYSVHIMVESKKPVTWHNFNSENWPIFLGTAVYVFEGIGLVLPIYDAMDSNVRHKFPLVLSNTIAFLVAFFCLFAGLVYAAFGDKTVPVVTLNLPNEGINAGRISVQLAYCLALIFTYPLMMYPALMILEGYFIPTTGLKTKGASRWRKNIFRFLLVCTTAGISLAGLNELDNFVALIGGFCSVPLAFIYPCLFHLRLVGTHTMVNWCIIIVGILTMIFATYQALKTWGAADNPREYCDKN